MTWYAGYEDLRRIKPQVDAFLPEYSREDVASHTCLETGVWVTYGNNVYDITEFVENHPGGKKIMLAAGGDIGPFWEVYNFHKSEEIREMLETYHIGRLPISDQLNFKNKVLKDPYTNDPSRHPALKPNSVKPYDAETPESLITEHLKTPNDLFYVRNHLPVPDLDAKVYDLEVKVDGGNRSIKLNMDDLKKDFKQHTLEVTLQCAGNRREEMGRYRKIYGAKSGITAIGNAEWTGVLLRDVLIAAGIREDDDRIQHVQFEGYDVDISGESYSTSIPFEKAISPGGDVLLAYEMNGEPLPRDHGYPLRVIVPGMVGARSVKWLKRIVVSPKESSSFWHQNDYKSTPPFAEWDKFDFIKASPIYEWPVQSVICSPEEGEAISKDAEITVKGYAYSGGGNVINRVDVSVDGGTTWHQADLQQSPMRLYKGWAWTLWSAQLPVDTEAAQLQVVCKATDASHNVQPENISSIWNLRGFLNNSWHKVNIVLETEQE